ncbi:MAG: 3'-5' exonuclease [Desulfobulbaceae bacterium]|nr:MAG: 3'-5' exonuclease [Desulfobulbaceae bacterium]
MFDRIRRLPWFKPADERILENRAYFKDFDQTRPLTDYSFVVFDTELTGLNRKKDEIISIGAVRIKNLQIDLGETFHRFIKPEKLDHTEATLVHRITPEQLKDAPPMEQVLPEFLSFVGNSLIVGHYVGLDMSFLHRVTEKHYNGTLMNPCVDTIRMAQGYKRVMFGYYHEGGTTNSRYSLKDLSEEFNLPFFEAHDALEDAMQTAYLFLYLIKKFRKGGLITLRELYQAGRESDWRVLSSG